MAIQLTNRQTMILFGIVQKYIQTALPVGSQYLTQNYAWNFSPATVRAEMNFLEDWDYIFQPHTSAGRIPREQGYRTFVNSILADLPIEAKEILPEILEKEQYDSWSELFTELVNKLADLLSNVVIITTIDRNMYYAGLSYLLKQPEFTQTPSLMPLLELIEDTQNIFAFLQNLVFYPQKKLVVYIGKEHFYKSLHHFSSISSYFDNPFIKGWISVFGPTRLPYRKSLKIINQIASELESLQNY